MTKLIYLTDSYVKHLKTKVVSVTKKGDHFELVLQETIFYPEGGGQPSDKGLIVGKNGQFEVTHVRMREGNAIHEGKLKGTLNPGEKVECLIDWNLRFEHMRSHSAGHVLHEVVMQVVPGLTPVRGEHGKDAYIEYRGTINPKLLETLEKKTNMFIADGRNLQTEMVTLEELKKRAAWVPEKLPHNKPLRILQIDGCPPIPDGGTQVKNTSEIGTLKVTHVEQIGENVRIHYVVYSREKPEEVVIPDFIGNPKIDSRLGGNDTSTGINLNNFRSLVLEMEEELLKIIDQTSVAGLEMLKVKYFGAKGQATELIHKLKELSSTEKKSAGLLVNEFKSTIDIAFKNKLQTMETKTSWFDTSLPGIAPPQGHLHIVTQAIMEITRIFERIGFTRVRHPEVDWDYYAFESLNMPKDHPARDEWETFFVDSSKFIHSQSSGQEVQSSKFSKIVLTPHTSNGQVREMEKGKLPIRMINIAKCYRRQSDVSHVPMFHQFEGLYVDQNVSIGDLKGVFDFFVQQFYGPERKTRLRPFHFQFTEPSFEVDINCAVCLGKGILPSGILCRLCKSGWLELGGSGMVHPNVLKAGGIDPDKYNGFAFGWGVERTYMMKSGTQLDDVRLLYSNDVRFLEQF